MTLNRRMMIAAAGLAAGRALPASAQSNASKIKSLASAVQKAIQADGLLVLPVDTDRMYPVKRSSAISQRRNP